MCAASGRSLGFLRRNKIDLHHKLANTKVNRKLYPLIIDSLWNLVAVDSGAHLNEPALRMSVLEGERREAFLRRHPCISDAVNMRRKSY